MAAMAVAMPVITPSCSALRTTESRTARSSTTPPCTSGARRRALVPCSPLRSAEGVKLGGHNGVYSDGSSARAQRRRVTTGSLVLDTSLAASVAVPNALGVAVFLTCAPDVLGPWYSDLSKPSWTPPNPLFGVAWGIIYTGMGVASWLVWAKAGGYDPESGPSLPLQLYAANLACNLIWLPTFFKAKRLGAALYVNVALIALTASTGAAFFPSSAAAGLFFLGPYLAWVGFATALNWEIWRRERERERETERKREGEGEGEGEREEVRERQLVERGK